MPIEKIKKRTGAIVDFERDKIARAISKACVATSADVTEETIDDITDAIVLTVEEQFADTEAVPSVENVQDVVEKKIAEAGLFTVAKAYILYREEHKQRREWEKAQALVKMQTHQLHVKKRDGRTVPFAVDEIAAAIRQSARGYEDDIDIAGVVHDATQNVYDGIATCEIDQAVVLALRGRIERDPAYSSVAARYLFNTLYKDVFVSDDSAPDFVSRYRAGLAKSVERAVAAGRLDPRVLTFDLDRLATHLVPSRDNLFAYLGAQTLYDRYFLRDQDQRILETPQYFWMRVAMGLALAEPDKEARAQEFYDVMSQLRYVPSTPTLFHAGTTHPQMSSCYLTTVHDDLAHIFKCIGDNAQLSKWSGGLGNDWTNIRATGALIKSTNVGSQGVVPFLKIADATTAAINRSGKRRGATCVYLETWHYDIEDFLELRKNTGDDRRRTHDTNTANWIPDLFLQRVLNDGDWTLFSPDETPDLHELYGRAFAERYEAYERQAAQGKLHVWKKVKAQRLWRKMITMLFETGHPWITFKDPSNIRSPQDHVGVVHSSNLCTEITLNTTADETAVCNLGSLNLPAHVVDGALDRGALHRTIAVGMRMLDNVIDLNFYPTKEAALANRRHRPVGFGIMGFQDLLYQLKMTFDSEAAVELSDELLEFIAYHAILSSSQLAKERGSYETFPGSKWERGIFPIDTVSLLEQERGLETGVPKTSRLDWSLVKAHVAEHGMRNSNTMAIAPTATISNISGSLPSIEPIYKNIYVKSNVSGEFTIINRALVEELKRRRLWGEDMLAELKFHDGSVQEIEDVPADLKARFKEVFEIEPIWLMQHAARRGKWIDQSQSLNLFVKTTSGKSIAAMYVAAWRLGLKTTYYLRSLGASAIEKSTLDTSQPAARPLHTAVPAAPVVRDAPVAVPRPATVAAPQAVAASSGATVAVVSPAPNRPLTTALEQAVTRPLSHKKIYIAEDAICEACE